MMMNFVKILISADAHKKMFGFMLNFFLNFHRKLLMRNVVLNFQVLGRAKKFVSNIIKRMIGN